MGWFDNGWGLSLIVFLPLVGTVAVLFTPKKNEAAIKALSLGFHRGDPGAGHPHGHPVRFRKRRHVPVRNKSHLDRVDQLRLSHRYRRDITTPPGAVRARHRAGRDLLVQSLAGTAQPERVHGVDAAPGHRYERDVRGAGSGALLRVLRTRAAPDVLHDRDLGRQGRDEDPGLQPGSGDPLVRLDQVLPLHPVRVGLHAAWDSWRSTTSRASSGPGLSTSRP